MSARTLFLSEYPKAIVDDTAAIFVGAGVSMGAGYPSWKDLLKDIGDELGVQTSDVHDLAALAQWSDYPGRWSRSGRVGRAGGVTDQPLAAQYSQERVRNILQRRNGLAKDADLPPGGAWMCIRYEVPSWQRVLCEVPEDFYVRCLQDGEP